MDKKFYIINYKETTIDNGVIKSPDCVDCGSFDYGHETEEEAKKNLIDIAQKAVDDVDDDVEIIECWNDDKDLFSLFIPSTGYLAEYWVYMITIPDRSAYPF